MPSTFTDALSLEKQATGEANNLWGTNLNAVLDQIDKAIAARLAKSVAGSSDVTLTSAEALNMFHEYTGTLTGNINVIVPAKDKVYFVYNNTSGSFTLTVKTSAGTGIAVPQGQKMLLYCDGTDVIRAVDYFSGVPDATARDEFVAMGQIQDGDGVYAADTGTADNYAIAPTPAITAYAAGQSFRWKVANANTGAAVLNVSTLGNKNILWPDGTALSAGDLPANAIVETDYDGTQFLLMTVAQKPGTAATVDTGAAAGEVALNDQNWTAIASAGTVNIGAAATERVNITGTTTITAFDTVAAGIAREVRFDGALTLTHNATSLILPGGANITTAAGDIAKFVSEGSGNWRCERYQKADGRALAGAFSDLSTIGTAEATTGASTFTRTGLPAGIRVIIVSLNGVSISSAGQMRLRLGDSGGLATTGYVGAVGSASAQAIWSIAMDFVPNPSAGTTMSGVVILTLTDPATNTWSANFSMGRHDASSSSGVSGGGYVALSGELDRIQLLGVSNFDAGSWNILYM